MSELYASPFFGVALSVLAFWIGVRVQKKTGLAICNPLLIAALLVIGALLLLGVPYDDYNQGGELITLFLSPATAALAVSIYNKIQLLGKNWLPVVSAPMGWSTWSTKNPPAPLPASTTTCSPASGWA